MAVASRFLNCGQSCIAAKRCIVVPQIADEFLHRLKIKVETLKVGDPLDDATRGKLKTKNNAPATALKEVHYSELIRK